MALSKNEPLDLRLEQEQDRCQDDQDGDQQIKDALGGEDEQERPRDRSEQRRNQQCPKVMPRLGKKVEKSERTRKRAGPKGYGVGRVRGEGRDSEGDQRGKRDERSAARDGVDGGCERARAKEEREGEGTQSFSTNPAISRAA